jgi:hypothetical protein
MNVIDSNKRRSIERYSTQGWSTREIASLAHTPASTVSRVIAQMKERKERDLLAAKRGDLFKRERIDVGLDQVFFAMERVKAGRDPDLVAVELGIPAVLLRQLGEGVLMIPFKGKSLAIKMERGKDREGSLARALGMAEIPDTRRPTNAPAVDVLIPEAPMATESAKPFLRLVSGSSAVQKRQKRS